MPLGDLKRIPAVSRLDNALDITSAAFPVPNRKRSQRTPPGVTPSRLSCESRGIRLRYIVLSGLCCFLFSPLGGNTFFKSCISSNILGQLVHPPLDAFGLIVLAVHLRVLVRCAIVSKLTMGTLGAAEPAGPARGRAHRAARAVLPATCLFAFSSTQSFQQGAKYIIFRHPVFNFFSTDFHPQNICAANGIICPQNTHVKHS